MHESPFLGDNDFFKSKQLHDNGSLIKSDQKENTLSKVKKILISILQKQLKKSIEGDFFNLNEELLIKGKTYPVGTTREWQGKKYKKIRQGKWMLVYSGEESRGEKLAIAKTIKKIQAAKDIKELAQIVRDNKKRFLNSDGSTHPVVTQLLGQAKEKRGDKPIKEESPESKSSKLKSLEDVKKDFYENSKYGPKFKNNPELKKKKDKELEKEWFNNVFNFAKEGNFVDWKTLNKVWNLNKEGDFARKLLHDVPNGNWDTKWSKPERGKTAVGYTRKETSPAVDMLTKLKEKGLTELVKDDKGKIHLINKKGTEKYTIIKKDYDKYKNDIHKMFGDFNKEEKEIKDKIAETQKEMDKIKEKPKGQTQQTYELENLMGKELTTPDGAKIKIVGYDQSNKKHPRVVVETEGKKGETRGYDKKQVENWISGKKEEQKKIESKGIDKLDLSENKFYVNLPILPKKAIREYTKVIHNDEKAGNLMMTNGKSMLIMKKNDAENKLFEGKKNIGDGNKEKQITSPTYDNIRFDDNQNTVKTNKSISDITKQIQSIDKEKKEYQKKLEKEIFNKINKENLQKDKVVRKSPQVIEKTAKKEARLMAEDVHLIVDKSGNLSSSFDFKAGKEKKIKNNEIGLNPVQLLSGLKTINNTRGDVKNLNLTIREKDDIFKISGNNQDIEYFLMPKK